MTRIIGGAAGGRTIAVPPTGTRPTSDRVREAVFSALEARGAIEDAEVLDLFAGSGALGIEALSRGASTAILVERDPRACGVIQSNIGVAGVHGAMVRRSAVEAFLKKTPGPVDLVFVDPPYGDPVDDVLARLPRWLRSGGVVVLERDTRSPAPVWPDGLEPEEPRTYGETTVYLATAA
ncbi:16S rRNA (guanine(966)-N(2))-methyltransferase RsmD [Actinomycetospora sp. C-140]